LEGGGRRNHLKNELGVVGDRYPNRIKGTDCRPRMWEEAAHASIRQGGGNRSLVPPQFW